MLSEVEGHLSMAGESLTINEQLSNHLANQAGKPAAKRKRSSMEKATVAMMQQSLETKKIGFIGAGNMARSIVKGWLSLGEERKGF